MQLGFQAIALGIKIVPHSVRSLIKSPSTVFPSRKLNFMTPKQFIFSDGYSCVFNGHSWCTVKEFFDYVLYQFQFTRTAPKFTTPADESVECTKSILMVWVNLKCFVIRKQPVEVGRCFRRDRTAL